MGLDLVLISPPLTMEERYGKFAALGEVLYQWAEEEAMNEVERSYLPYPRF